MNHYLPSDEANSERILMIQKQERNGEFAHIIAYVVRRAVADHVDPDSTTGRMIYADGKNATGYRNATWSSAKKNAVYVDGFSVRSQLTVTADAGSRERKPYGTRYVYRDVYEVDARNSAHMANTFKVVGKKITEIQDTYGYVDDSDVAAFIIRLGVALGIKTFAYLRPKYPRASLEQSDCYNEVPTFGVARVVDEMIASYFPSND